MIRKLFQSLWTPAVVRLENLVPVRTSALNRRAFLTGAVAVVAAPAIVRATSLMPIKMNYLGEIFQDSVSGFPIEGGTLADIDKFLWDQLTDMAVQQRLQLRRPRFENYTTASNIHRRCLVDVFGQPGGRLIS